MNEEEQVKSTKSWIKIKGLRLVRITMPDAWTKKKMKLLLEARIKKLENIIERFLKILNPK